MGNRPLKMRVPIYKNVIHNDKEMGKMKEFKMPTLTVVRLTKENIICASFCYDFYCDDCVECTGVYHCWDFLCNEKYSG